MYAGGGTAHRAVAPGASGDEVAMPKDGGTLNARIRPMHIMLRSRPKGVPKAYFDRVIGGAGMPRLWFIGALCLQMLSALLLWIGQRRVAVAFASELAASHGFMCLECGYSLVGSAKSDVCPECNVAIDLWSIRTTWYEWFPETLDRCTAEARGDA